MSTIKKIFHPSHFASAERAEQKEVLSIRTLFLKSKLDRIIEVIPNMCLVLNRHRQVIASNTLFRNFVNQKEENIIGKRPGEIILCLHVDEQTGGCGTSERCKNCPSVNAIISSLDSKSHGAIITEGEIVTSKGTLQVQVIAARFISDYKDLENENLVLCTITDISEKIKQTKEKELLQRKMHIAARLTSLSILSSGMAHEINNPLMIIKGNLDILREKIINKTWTQNEALDLLNPADIAVDRIASIVSNLKKHATGTLAKSICDVHEIINVTLDILEKYLQTFTITIVKDLSATSNIIEISANEFEFILTSLIKNSKDAIREAERNLGVIKISTKNIDNKILIEITDNGKGIKKEHIDNIFEPFFTTKSTDRVKNGGLSLSTARSILVSAGGTIEAISDGKHETTFKLIIPTKTE